VVWRVPSLRLVHERDGVQPDRRVPLSRWAKMLMLVESAVSLVLAIMVAARAVNILH